MGSLSNAVSGGGLPVTNPCLSFWQQTTRSFPYLNANEDQAVPGTSKYVVIGSGISGALASYELIEGGAAAKDITILEAREAASGASSRNAGHVRPGQYYDMIMFAILIYILDAFRGFQVYQRVHGKEQALKIIANERTVFNKVDEFVQKHGVDCDFHPTTTFDVCLTQEFADFNAQSFKEYQEAGGDVSHVKFYEGEEAKQKTRIAQAVTAYEWPAGSSHPAKLAQWLLTRAIEKGANFFTHCPATSVTSSPSSTPESQLWDVATPRGVVTASHVVHCTNAFAPHLLPQLSSFVTPNRAQAHAFVPPSSLNGANVLKSTMSLRHSLKHFYSVAHRRPDGIIILGASRDNPNISEAALNSRLIPDDSAFNEEVEADVLYNWSKCFPDCEPARLKHGEGLLHTWTGIIAMTPDSVPYVGAVPGSPGQWICAGFNGHGM